MDGNQINTEINRDRRLAVFPIDNVSCLMLYIGNAMTGCTEGFYSFCIFRIFFNSSYWKISIKFYNYTIISFINYSEI